MIHETETKKECSEEELERRQRLRGESMALSRKRTRKLPEELAEIYYDVTNDKSSIYLPRSRTTRQSVLVYGDREEGAISKESKGIYENVVRELKATAKSPKKKKHVTYGTIKTIKYEEVATQEH